MNITLERGKKYHIIYERRSPSGEVTECRQLISIPRNKEKEDEEIVITGIDVTEKSRREWSKALAGYKKAKSILKAECNRKDYYKIFTSDTEKNNIYTRTSQQIKDFAKNNKLKCEDYNKFIDFINANINYARNARRTSFRLRDAKEVLKEKKLEKTNDNKPIVIKPSDRKEFIPIESGLEPKITGMDENGKISYF